MPELKKQETEEKFDKFWNIVQNTAEQQGKKFFMDCGEGREFFLEDMEGEDLRGWLVPLEMAQEFESEWVKNEVSDKWLDSILWAEWINTDGIISIEFNKY